MSVCSLIADASVRSSSHSGNALGLAVALLAQVPEPPVVKVEVILGLDELRRGFGVVDALHCGAPFRICAMWMNLIGRPSRSAHPF